MICLPSKSLSTENKMNEQKRLEEMKLYDLNEIDKLDPGLQSITDLIAKICETPMSFINLVEEEELVNLSSIGYPLDRAPRTNSFCNVVIQQSNVFEVYDSLNDIRFNKNQWVDCSQPLRFYAAYPLRSPKGYNFGTLCVCDFFPRKLNNVQRLALKVLSSQVMIQLELRRQNKCLKRSILKTNNLSKARDEFVSNINHEIRNPLNAINGYSEILEESKLDDNQKEAVSVIKSSVEIISHIVNDIIDCSKIQSGNFKLNKHPYNFVKSMQNLKSLFMYKIKTNKNLKLKFIIDKNIPTFLIGDKLRINQVLMNLIGNSLKFTEKGYVTLHADLIENEPSYVNIKFSIKDSGIGIAEDKLESIFERYKQATPETTRRFGGTGLGLNICKSIVEMHNSKLKVTSKLNVGSTFYFEIKFVKCDELNKLTNLKTIKPVNYDLFKSLNILICEDNLINIKLIKNLFSNLNSNLTFAQNGNIALNILENKKDFDLILMDIHMPQLNGIEITNYIRKVMNLPTTIIGFSSAFTECEKKSFIKSGMNDFIKKTFNKETFFNDLSKSLKIHSFKNTFEKLLPINKLPSTKNFNHINLSDNFECDKNYYSDNNLSVVPKKNQIKNKETKIKLIDKDLKQICISQDQKDLDGLSIIKINNFKLEQPENKSKLIFHKFTNEQVNNKLREYFEDDISIKKEYIELFLKEIPNELKMLECHLENDDLEGARFIVHKIKGPLMMFDMTNSFLHKGYLSNGNDKSKIKSEYENFKCEVDSIICVLEKIREKT